MRAAPVWDPFLFNPDEGQGYASWYGFAFGLLCIVVTLTFVGELHGCLTLFYGTISYQSAQMYMEPILHGIKIR